MSEQRYWTEQHRAIHNQIEDLKKKKYIQHNETVLVDIPQGIKKRMPKYGFIQLEKLDKDIDLQIEALETKFLSVPFKYRDITILQEPIIFNCLQSEFQIIWRPLEHKWKAYPTLVGVDYKNSEVITDEQNRPIKLRFLMQSSETYGKPYRMEANLVEYKQPKAPQLLPNKPIPKTPTWICISCGLENYIDSKQCRKCNKPRDSEAAKELGLAEPQPEDSSKLKRIKDFFSKD